MLDTTALAGGGAGLMRGQAWWALPAAAALAYLLLTFHAARVETPTVDEVAHVPAGLASWRYGRTDLYRSNPPFLKLLLSAPLALDPSVKAPAVLEPSMGWGPWEYAHRFMNANHERYLSLMLRPRLVPIALGLFAALTVLLWAREVFGLRAAAIVSSLFLLCPNVLAHAHLATIDMGALFTILLACFALRSALRRPSLLRLLLAGACLGLALATKFLGVLLLPAVPLLASMYRWRETRHPPTGRLLRAAADSALVLLAAIVVINASVGFQDSFRKLGSLPLRSQFATTLQTALPGSTPVPLPREYILGFDGAKEISEHGEFGSYLLGRWSDHGWWYYNLVALGVKLPIVVLALLATSGFFWWRSRIDRMELYAIAVPLLLLVGIFSTASNLNIGMRHVLPAIPFLFLLLGPIFETTPDRKRERFALSAAAAALLASAVNAATLHPNYLTFFNVIGGGPEGGSKWLLDSNLDWGQDLYRVHDAVTALAPEETPYLLYFGHVDPVLYGLRYRLLPPTPVEGIVAVSENFLHGMSYLSVAPDGAMVGVAGDTAAWLLPRKPVMQLGSIRIYDTRKAGPTEGGHGE